MRSFFVHVFAKLSLACFAIVMFTSCDVALVALSMIASMADTSTYAGTGYASGYYAGNSVDSSSDSDSRWENTYVSSYNMYVRGFESDLRTLNSLSSGTSSYTQVKMNLLSRQKSMQRVRNEAAQKGIVIPMSRYETMSL
jgi:hypothetical protein